MRKHLACVDVALFLVPDVIFHLIPNYTDLVKIKYDPANSKHHFSFDEVG